MKRRSDEAKNSEGSAEPAGEASGPVGSAEIRSDRLPPEFFSGEGMLALADLLPVMVAYADREQRVQFMNRMLADWMERPRSEMIGRTISELIGEESYQRRRPMLEAALAGERQFFTADLDHPSRGRLCVQTEYVPWAGPDGEVRGLVFVVQDVTEQRAADRALRESEERFRRIADRAPVLIWVTRLDGVREFVNQAYVEFSGLSREEARNLDWRDRIHPDDRDRIVAESLAGMDKAESFTLEGRFRHADGEYRWLQSVSSPRFGPDGGLIGFLGVATDITLAKESELELKRQVEERTRDLARSEAQFRAVFEAALEVMVLLKPDGTVIAVNSRRESWRAPDPQRAVGLKLWDTPTLQSYPQHIPLMTKAVEQAARGEPFSAEVRMERPGTPTAHLDLSIQPVRGEDGEIIYLLFEARDITDLKAAQEQLRQSQKMEALGQLTGGIAHDFNNLLTVVVGGLDLIAKRVEDERLKVYATNALAAAERGARLTGQLLAFSRVQRLEVRPVLVTPIVEDMLPLLHNVLGPRIEKKLDLDPQPVAVMADPTQLELAVLNLAINARDAMADGGVLTIASRRLSIASDPELADGDYVELSIGDTGLGMSEEVRSRAFEPFFTTKEVGKGTGLGLSMVYGVARQSGGTARIRSVAGEGTCVSLFFRCAEEEAEPAGAAPSAAGEEQGRKAASVLVIDDDPDVRDFIANSLEELGYTVLTAEDGQSGLDLFAKERPDLVILDFVMPGLSGAEVASRIFDGHPGQPILFVSGYSETEAIRRTAPTAPLLSKPFRAEALDRAVRSALALR